MKPAEASIELGALRDVVDEYEEDVAPDASEDDAFEQAAEAQDATPIAALEPGRRRKPSASLILQPAEREARSATLKLRAREQDVKLKRLLAWVAIVAVGLQLVVADLFLAHYILWADEPPSDTVLIAWLSASVVEVIGIVAIVARNLFPDRTKRGSRKDK